MYLCVVELVYSYTHRTCTHRTRTSYKYDVHMYIVQDKRGTVAIYTVIYTQGVSLQGSMIGAVDLARERELSLYLPVAIAPLHGSI